MQVLTIAWLTPFPVYSSDGCCSALLQQRSPYFTPPSVCKMESYHFYNKAFYCCRLESHGRPYSWVTSYLSPNICPWLFELSAWLLFCLQSGDKHGGFRPTVVVGSKRQMSHTTVAPTGALYTSLAFRPCGVLVFSFILCVLNTDSPVNYTNTLHALILCWVEVLNESGACREHSMFFFVIRL